MTKLFFCLIHTMAQGLEDDWRNVPKRLRKTVFVGMTKANKSMARVSIRHRSVRQATLNSI